MEKFLLAIVLSFLVCLVVAPLVISYTKKLKANQTVLHYVELHKGKTGTPTMGGIIFIVGTIVVSFLLFDINYTLAGVALACFLAYGILGFLDDYIKVKYKQNEGLNFWQKIISQFAIALIVAFFVYTSPLIGSGIIVPILNFNVDLYWVIIPFVLFVFIATTNGVNLTDGLDGLAGGVSFAYFIGFSFILYLTLQNQADAGQAKIILQEYSNLLIVCGAIMGALLAYLMFNSNKASIFMGDTGSMALGGLVCCLAVLTKLTLLIPILGLMFVVSSVSVIIQVLYYKKTKKRVFLMAPLHHHFEKKGWNETKIATIYIIITVFISVLTIWATIVMGG